MLNQIIAVPTIHLFKFISYSERNTICGLKNLAKMLEQITVTMNHWNDNQLT